MNGTVSFFRRFLLPGFILKSVIIGGGYATGREFATFFLSYGPWGGLLGVFTATVGFSLVYAASLEFARMYRAFDYKTFFQKLLGRGWVLFEILYLTMLLLVLSVIAATCGHLLFDNTGLPRTVGTLVFMASATALAFYGARTLERFLVFWSFVLYTFYISFVILCLWRFGDLSSAQFANTDLKGAGGPVFGGIKYAGYNISAMTGAIFCAVHLKSRKDAIIGGLLGGPLAMLPGLLFYIAMVAFYPKIVDVPVPMDVLLHALNLPIFQALFLIVLFSALIGTGAALLHALNERLAADRILKEKDTPRWMRGAVAAAALAISLFLAEVVGLTSLVEKGYGYITFGFIAVFMIPILTVGVWRMIKDGPERPAVEELPT